MKFPMLIPAMLGIVAVTAIEGLALYLGMNGKFLAGSLFMIGFLGALPLAPEKVIDMFKKLIDKVMMKCIILAVAGLLSGVSTAGCDKVNVDPKTALDCISCLVQCAGTIVADKDTGEKCKLEGKELVRVGE